MPAKCKHCGRTNDLYWDSFVDEDGFRYEEPSDICNVCVEISYERSQQRKEWNQYHDEPCPEIEMTPFPHARPEDT